MKTYCISDIHGHLDNLKRFTKTLSKNDRVYVLGDVVDKGPKSIECLLFIMNDKRFKLLLGNHDYMMYKYITSLDIETKYMYFNQWFKLNEGEKTFNKFNSLDHKTQDKIIDYLSNLQTGLLVKVKDKSYLLAHADPNAREDIKAKDNPDIVEDIVWRRIYKYDFDFRKEKVIVGHTPVQLLYEDLICKPYFKAETIDKAKVIVIDGGLANVDITKGKLIALCLDDLTYTIY